MTVLAVQWAPAIGSSIDASTQLGKTIARSLYSTVREKGIGESNQQYDKEAFSSYRTNYLDTLICNTTSNPEQQTSKQMLVP